LEVTENRFDLVLDIGCYHRLNESSRKHYREILQQGLKPGGIFLLYGHSDSLFPVEKKDFVRDKIYAFQEFLELEKRQDGEERRGIVGVWLWFKKCGG
jgi:SAM-dependent methyltransferase